MAAFSTDTVIGVIGAGAMGAGIAQVAAAAGHPVLLFDTAEAAITAGIERTAKGLDRQVSRNKMTLAARDALLERLVPCTAIEDLAPAGLVIEAIIEDLEVKQQVFRQLESICGPEVVFCQQHLLDFNHRHSGSATKPRSSAWNAFFQSGAGHETGRSRQRCRDRKSR